MTRSDFAGGGRRGADGTPRLDRPHGEAPLTAWRNGAEVTGEIAAYSPPGSSDVDGRISVADPTRDAQASMHSVRRPRSPFSSRRSGDDQPVRDIRWRHFRFVDRARIPGYPADPVRSSVSRSDERSAGVTSIGVLRDRTVSSCHWP